MLDGELQAAKHQAAPRSPEADVEAALELAKRLTDLANGPGSLKIAAEAIRLADLKMFLRFEQTPKGKRTLNKVVSGVVTLGLAEPPIAIYSGKTNREAVTTAGPTSCKDAGPAVPKVGSSNSEEESLGNVNRGDRI